MSGEEGEGEAAAIEVEDRHARVIALYSKGFNQAEIAEKLGVNQSTVSRDLREMRERSKKEIEKHVIKDALFEFYRCAAGMNEVTKKAWEIVEDEKAAHKSKMEALSFLVGCYNRRLEMLVGSSDEGRPIAEMRIQQVWERVRLESGNSILGGLSPSGSAIFPFEIRTGTVSFASVEEK